MHYQIAILGTVEGIIWFKNMVRKFKFSFVQVSMYTGYTVGLAAALMFFWVKDPLVLHMVPLARLFIQTAQISVEIERDQKQDKLKDKQN